MASRGWTCRRAACGHLNHPEHVKCRGEGCEARRPRKPVRKHARALREVPYRVWAELSVEIHGGELDACGVCTRMPDSGRHCDRDHDHDTGLPRGLACGGDFGCNRMMPRGLTGTKALIIANMIQDEDARAWAVAPYLPRDFTAERAFQIADYLFRYEAHHESGFANSVRRSLTREIAEKADRG